MVIVVVSVMGWLSSGTPVVFYYDEKCGIGNDDAAQKKYPIKPICQYYWNRATFEPRA
jgi:hypothetical protein